MGKATKIIIKKEDNKKNIFWMSMFLLAVMLISVVGFALSGTSQTGSSSNTPTEIPFQEFSDPNTGKIYWGAIRGGEQFIFLNISGFDSEQDMAEIAYKIKQLSSLNIYKGANFSDASSEFLIKKALKGLKIETQKQYVLDCTTPTLVLGTKFEDKSCFNFLDYDNTTYHRAEALVYYLVQE